MSCPAIELAQQLIRRSSLGPDDAGCQTLLIERSQAIGFTVERMDLADTRSFQAWRGQGETLAFVGHTDVAPPDNANRWINLPFESTICDGTLFGRGTANMKGLLATMVAAAECLITQHPSHTGRLASLITSDEEASTHNGTVKVAEVLVARNECLDYCLVGGSSSIEAVDDVVKNDRRGPLTCSLTIHGVQGYVTYPHLAGSPIHRVAPFINELVTIEWDQGSEFSPATSMQTTNIQAGTGSNNVIPDGLSVQFNFRFSTELTGEMIKVQALALLKEHQLRHTANWWLSRQPSLTVRDKLMDAAVSTIEHYNEAKLQLLITGGASDRRLIARIGAQVVELGPVNATIHKVNECVNTAGLQLLARMYQRIIEQLVA